MVRVTLTVGQDHVAQLARLGDPVGAVEELIWNGLDADAEHVVVELGTNDLGGVETVTVTDDGTGMVADACAEYFQPIGKSWKSSAGVSVVKKRVLHGKNGRGRIRAFALGNEVRWTSVAEGSGGRQRVAIEADRGAMHEYDISEAEAVTAPTGTVFEAFGGSELQRLTDRRTLTTLTAAFAVHLEAYPDISVIYDGERLDPAAMQANVAEYPIGAASEGTPEAPRLKIIEWRRPVNRELILCDVRGMPLARLKPEIQAPGFDFTAYVSWSGFERSPDDLMFADWTPDTEEAEVVAAARERLRMHFRMRAEQRRQDIVKAWRDEGVYPYNSEPADGRERAERETFDTVATTVVKHLPKAKSARRAILGLLRSAVAHEPTHTVRLLEELFSLTKQEQVDLARLLDRTRLSSLIQASTAVTDRFDFLAALELLVFEPELKGRVRERTELHRILENESWVFGEEYGLFVSDRSLTEVLRRHCALLGRDAPGGGPVLREDGRQGVVDLMLSRAGLLRKGERHHLVVELKRPKLTLGMGEFEQLSSYAQAVMSDDRFRDTRVTWDFWLVGNDMSASLRSMASQSDRAPGCALDQGTWRLWVRTWGEIIQDCEERLRFYREELEYQSGRQHAVDYLIRKHPDAVSDLVADGALVPAARSANDAEPAGADGLAV
ncbi:ATP-binding protein [Streptomyces sp. NPDC052236]|uniref:ATP-binding protein n=1 Tax=Streptomyces sp. NPDC052236 TaxID=3365686 RepID=UPI0037D47447